MLLCRILRASNHHREKRVRNVGNNHPDRVSFLRCQAARQKVRAVIQPADCRFHALPQFLANVTLMIDDC
jgi:hypothetical protein